MLAEAGWLEEQAKLAVNNISNASINRELAALKRMFSLPCKRVNYRGGHIFDPPGK
jgi:hypothetical protein